MMLSAYLFVDGNLPIACIRFRQKCVDCCIWTMSCKKSLSEVVRPICLPAKKSEVPLSGPTVIAGWGLTEAGKECSFLAVSNVQLFNAVLIIPEYELISPWLFPYIDVTYDSVLSVAVVEEARMPSPSQFSSITRVKSDDKQQNLEYSSLQNLYTFLKDFVALPPMTSDL